MNIRRLASLVAFLGLALPGLAPAEPTASAGPLQSPLWLRYPAVSPDGRQIAFAFEGSLFVVPAAGGTARLLVSNGHHSLRPVWSPDGSNIAYASDTYGNFDIFVVAAEGGPSRRLTSHSAPELPLSFTPDGKEVLFTAQRLDARTNLMFPGRVMSELYKVSIEPERRPVQVLTTPALAARFNRAGTQMLYEDLKGYESLWRKHHVSPVAHDIWVYDVASHKHRQLTTFGGEDREPVWAPDERSVYYLSERSGTSNVWKMPLDRPDAAVQVTRFEKNPVRFLSIAADGMLSFGWDGEIYSLAPGADTPQKVTVRIGADLRASSLVNLKLAKGATEMAPSPDGQEIAFVVRGEIFVASTEFGDTKRITQSPALERSVSFSPDGRRLVFAGERDGSWNLYEASVADSRRDSPYFFSAAKVEIKTLLKNGHENFQPQYSPDGKQVAYLEDRVTLKVLDLASGATRVVVPGDLNYSYADGDRWFSWSPDGRWLLFQYPDRNRWTDEVGLIDAAGKGPVVNLTQSGYEDTRPIWARGGRSMLWFSDRMGLHGSGSGGGAEQDVFAMFFSQEALDRHRLSKAEYALLKKQEDEDAKARDEKKKEARPGADARSSEKKEDDKKDNRVVAAREKAGLPNEPIRLADPVPIDIDNRENRIARLTPSSGHMRAAAVTPDGETLFYLAQTDDSYEVWINRPRSKEAKKIATLPSTRPLRDEEPADLLLDAKGENGFVLSNGTLHKFKVPKEMGEPKVEALNFSAEMRLDRAAERAQMFEHVWRQTKEKLYVENMNGVDWEGYRRIYAKFLPYIADNQDFAECLSEMLGELNVSHTGANFGPRRPDSDQTAALGIFVDDAWPGAGLKVSEVIDGGPLANSRAIVKAGSVIEKIDGTAIAPGAAWDGLLDNKAGKRVELVVLDPATGQRATQAVKPISLGAQSELLYRRWVRQEREIVDRLSGGQVGYVHVRGMNDASYRDTYAEILGRQSGKKALIVDTRFNGGGNLHDELATLLAGKRYLEFLPRGQSLGFEPANKWTQPSLVLMSESNYSDAHLFPWTYRKLGIGKLLGMPVAGTGTAVWWETLQDDTLVFGIPQVGFREEGGGFMEKALIEPDIRVANDADVVAAGRDQQLEAAVRELLRR